MGAVDTEAIILRTYKLAEADKIVVCLTKSEGMVRGVARGARRLKSRFGASLEPFTYVSLSFHAKEGSELVRLQRAEIIKSNFALSKDPDLFGMVEYLGQLVIEFAPPHQKDEKLFRLLIAVLEAVNQDASVANAVRPYFELWLLRLNGFLPDLTSCSVCERLLEPGGERVSLTADGSLRCRRCSDEPCIWLEPGVHHQLVSMNRLSPGKWARQFWQLPEDQRKELSRLATHLTLRVLEKESIGRKSAAAASALPETTTLTVQ